MKYVSEYLIIVCILSIFFVVEIHQGGIQNSLRPVSVVALNKKIAAGTFLKQFNKQFETCDKFLINRHTKLTTAIVSVEFGSTSLVEVTIENIILKLFLSIDLELPDYSYGVAQLKPSTLKKYLPGRLSNLDVGTILLNKCLSLEYADLIIDNILLVTSGDDEQSDRSIDMVAAK